MKKNILLSVAAALTIFSGCNSDSGSSPSKENTTGPADTAAAGVPATSGTATVSEVLAAYLQLKNALAADNAKEAAAGGNSLASLIVQVNTDSLSPEGKKVYQEVRDDMKEHGEHIGANAGKIAHQREHFEMLSQDVYDLVKATKNQQTLYLDFCPMYNEGKGTTWVSETKAIKNPYLGGKMPTCGKIKEEIK